MKTQKLKEQSTRVGYEKSRILHPTHTRTIPPLTDWLFVARFVSLNALPLPV